MCFMARFAMAAISCAAVGSAVAQCEQGCHLLNWNDGRCVCGAVSLWTSSELESVVCGQTTFMHVVKTVMVSVVCCQSTGMNIISTVMVSGVLSAPPRRTNADRASYLLGAQDKCTLNENKASVGLANINPTKLHE